MAKKVNKTEEQFANVEESLSKAGLFVEKNQKSLLIIIGSVVVLIGIFLAYSNYYVIPLEKQASADLFPAEFYIMDNNYEKALHGDTLILKDSTIKIHKSLTEISQNYSSTDAANLAYYYTAIAQLNLGEFENAISSLNDFDTEDEILYSLKTGLIADANLELGNTDIALEMYVDAATDYVNDFTTPYFMMKQAMVHEVNGDYSKSLEIYKIIKADYPNSREGLSIEQYISRAANN